MVQQTINHLESDIRGYVRTFPTVFKSASGSWLVDQDGRRFLDFFAGAGTLNYGHNNPSVKKALLSYIESDGVMHGLDTATVAKVELLKGIEEILLKPRNMDYKVQFTGPTGTNAVEAAVKLARKSKQRSHVVAFTNAYHGHSLGSLALTGNQYYHDISYGSHNNVSHLPFDGYLGKVDTSELLEKMLSDVSSGLPIPAAIILETVQGEGGINVASFDWLRRIERICRRHDILLIADDIQVGNGRTGSFFSFEPAGIEPDIICISKAFGGGLPMSLLLMRRECDTWKPGEHTGTFRGNNLAFVAARVLLEYWRDNQLSLQIQEHAKFIEQKLKQLLSQFSSTCSDVRGRGMIWGIEFSNAEMASLVCRKAFEKGLLIETSGARDHVVKLLPPLTISSEDLRYGLSIVKDSIESVLEEEKKPSVCFLPKMDALELGLPIGSFASF
ncbi:MAG: diaminobutyrate--2-oxoglutarate transaminase [Planctomycetota bacterium]|nr:diaminobutyrate--2-oxoglutarate transaminase [Planctomycetota bacterium]